MTTFADWTRDIVTAAEERGWAVVSTDARANVVVLEEPFGSGGLVLRITGRELDADFIRALPDASDWSSMKRARDAARKVSELIADKSTPAATNAIAGESGPYRDDTAGPRRGVGP